MKNLIFKLAFFAALVLQLLSCEDRFPSRYTLVLPQPPEQWAALLGDPWWRLEWFDSGGYKQTEDFPPAGINGINIEIPVTWTNPVTAWPYWPEHNLTPGLFKPCGALFPFDVSGGSLMLTWEAGHDSVFYWELAFAYNQNDSRLPANFDWQRFREYIKSEAARETVREDPWVVDWRSLAGSTVASTFYSSRLTPEAVRQVTFPVPEDTWYGNSPFAKPLIFENGEPAVFPVRAGINVWISTSGILRCNGELWVLSDI